MIIHLISSPRTISTALMYAFDNRDDCIGIDEPLYAHYLFHSEADHPGREEIMNSQSTHPEDIFDQINKMLSEHIFIKNMALHLEGINTSLFQDYFSIILIRQPANIISSYSKVISNLQANDVGIKQQYEIAQSLIKNNKNLIVINSDNILRAPVNMLTKLCRTLDLPFSNKMLKWDPGSRPIDGIWAKYWYKNTHLSTGFKNYQKNEITLTRDQEDVYNEVYPYYNKLMSLIKY